MDPRHTALTVKFLGALFSTTYSLVLAEVFFRAYFSPAKTNLVHINLFGEANLEAFLFAVTLPFVLYNFIDNTRRVRDAKILSLREVSLDDYAPSFVEKLMRYR